MSWCSDPERRWIVHAYKRVASCIILQHDLTSQLLCISVYFSLSTPFLVVSWLTVCAVVTVNPFFLWLWAWAVGQFMRPIQTRCDVTLIFDTRRPHTVYLSPSPSSCRGAVVVVCRCQQLCFWSILYILISNRSCCCCYRCKRSVHSVTIAPYHL